ncbi:MAG: signal peptidase I [Lachnospiraceae bacterium]|nr:signal peptidase I [Lachnospiraceae bacterium]
MEKEKKNINETAENKKEEKTGWKAELISWIQVLATAAVIAFVLTTFIIANSEVPTGSMENTIMAGSRVIGSRLHYKFSEPERGDVAIFVWGWQCPECGVMGEGDVKPDQCPRCEYNVGKRSQTVYYVKRVIGLPGDVIDIVDDVVYLNGSETPLDEPYLAEEMNQGETFHFEVPEGHYFMMGDNRNYSMDARYWMNPYISEDKMIAKVLFEYFPTPKLIK